MSRQRPAVLTQPFPGEPEWMGEHSSKAVAARADLWRIALGADAETMHGLIEAENRLKKLIHFAFILPFLLLPIEILVTYLLAPFGLLNPLVFLLGALGGLAVGMFLSHRTQSQLGYLSFLREQVHRDPLTKLVEALTAARKAGAATSPELNALLSVAGRGGFACTGLTQLGMEDRVALSVLAYQVSFSTAAMKEGTELVLRGENSDLLHRSAQAAWNVDLEEEAATLASPRRVAF